MYAALWRIIPGPLWLRITIATVATAVVVTLLMVFVFPWIDTMMTSQNSSVG
jgi:uncharacterized membrane protein